MCLPRLTVGVECSLAHSRWFVTAEKVDPSGIPFGHVAGHHSALNPRCLTSEGKMSPKSERYRCAGVQ